MAQCLTSLKQLQTELRGERRRHRCRSQARALAFEGRNQPPSDAAAMQPDPYFGESLDPDIPPSEARLLNPSLSAELVECVLGADHQLWIQDPFRGRRRSVLACRYDLQPDARARRTGAGSQSGLGSPAPRAYVSGLRGPWRRGTEVMNTPGRPGWMALPVS